MKAIEQVSDNGDSVQSTQLENVVFKICWHTQLPMPCCLISKLGYYGSPHQRKMEKTTEPCRTDNHGTKPSGKYMRKHLVSSPQMEKSCTQGNTVC